MIAILKAADGFTKYMELDQRLPYVNVAKYEKPSVVYGQNVAVDLASKFEMRRFYAMEQTEFFGMPAILYIEK